MEALGRSKKDAEATWTTWKSQNLGMLLESTQPPDLDNGLLSLDSVLYSIDLSEGTHDKGHFLVVEHTFKICRHAFPVHLRTVNCQDLLGDYVVYFELDVAVTIWIPIAGVVSLL